MSLPTKCPACHAPVVDKGLIFLQFDCGTYYDLHRDVRGVRDRSLHCLALERIADLHAVVDAAFELRNSGYDGPFIGDPVGPLFAALAALERKEMAGDSSAPMPTPEA